MKKFHTILVLIFCIIFSINTNKCECLEINNKSLLGLYLNRAYGSQTVIQSEKEKLEYEKQQIETARQNFKPYKCPSFEIGDKVSYSLRWTGCGDVYDNILINFIGIVVKVEPKPTTEYIHWITVKRISGKGNDGIYSEHFLVNLEK